MYRGLHKTSNLNDDYLGSGDHLRHAIKKYGKENFEKKVIFIAFDYESMVWAEGVLVDQCWVNRDDTYNIVRGGWVSTEKGRLKQAEKLKHIPKSAAHRQKISEANKGQISWAKGKKRGPHSKEHCINIGKSSLGRKHTLETRKLIGDSIRGTVPVFDIDLQKVVRVSKEDYDCLKGIRFFNLRTQVARDHFLSH